jgi:hypothetical protein
MQNVNAMVIHRTSLPPNVRLSQIVIVERVLQWVVHEAVVTMKNICAKQEHRVLLVEGQLLTTQIVVMMIPLQEEKEERLMLKVETLTIDRVDSLVQDTLHPLRPLWEEVLPVVEWV